MVIYGDLLRNLFGWVGTVQGCLKTQYPVGYGLILLVFCGIFTVNKAARCSKSLAKTPTRPDRSPRVNITAQRSSVAATVLPAATMHLESVVVGSRVI